MMNTRIANRPQWTRVVHPWALINGGSQRTQLAWLMERIEDDGKLIAYSARTWSERSISWSKTMRVIGAEKVIDTWRHRPDSEAFHNARERYHKRRKET